jgi:hypothetical protein
MSKVNLPFFTSLENESTMKKHALFILILTAAHVVTYFIFGALAYELLTKQFYQGENPTFVFQRNRGSGLMATRHDLDVARTGSTRLFNGFSLIAFYAGFSRYGHGEAGLDGIIAILCLFAFVLGRANPK